MTGERPQRPSYVEHPRSYASAAILLAVFALGFTIDLALGAGGSHAVGWALAALVVAGTDALIVRSARSLQTISVSATRLEVGEESVSRNEIADISNDIPDGARVLGRTMGTGLPRGVVGLALRMRDGTDVVIATKHPAALARALGMQTPEDSVRPATAADLPVLPEIDERAGTLFRISGYQLPDFEAAVPETPAAIFVWGDPAVGFVRIDRVDGVAHIQELAVIPGQMRRGIGTALLAAACDWARAEGFAAITLTTYRDVPWNAPYYRARGFVEAAETSPELAAIRQAERDGGLDAVGVRVVMRCELSEAPSATPRPT